VDGGTATVRAGALTVKVPLQALRMVRAGPPSQSSPGKGASAPNAGLRGARRRGEGTGQVPVELYLIGRTTEEGRDLLEQYLDDAFLAGLASIRIIHGKGTGALRRIVEEVLSGHPLVAEHRPGAPHEGGAGATVAVLGGDAPVRAS